ncbi:MAG: hypothetical protein K9I85_15790 [Saprospiraceae bacterium]|nr:hypothetical protein [Saprospiraceae bacterium]
MFALEINTWNEAAKNRDYEVKMLTEIKEGLGVDQLNLQEQIAAYTILENTVDHFTQLTQHLAAFNDTMQSELWKLNIGRFFQFNRGPYDALNASGIDRISNDSLRGHLINFFDSELKKFQHQLEHATRRYGANVELLLSMREYPFMDHDHQWIVNRITSDLLQKPEFIWLLADIEWRANSAKNTIEAFTPKIDALIQHIDTDLDP